MLFFTHTDQGPNCNLPCLLTVSEVPRSVSTVTFGAPWNILALIRQSRSGSYSRDLLCFFPPVWFGACNRSAWEHSQHCCVCMKNTSSRPHELENKFQKGIFALRAFPKESETN